MSPRLLLATPPPLPAMPVVPVPSKPQSNGGVGKGGNAAAYIGPTEGNTCQSVFSAWSAAVVLCNTFHAVKPKKVLTEETANR